MDDKIVGYILRKTDFKENDEIINVLTDDGIISFLAKGVKKVTSKNANALQLYAKSSFLYDHRPNRDIQLLKVANNVDYNLEVRENLDLHAIVAVVAEIILKLQEENDLYPLFDCFFNYLKENKENYTLLSLFLSDILKREGNQLMVDSCVNCNKTHDIISISVKDGGFICKDCFKGNQLYTINQLKSFRTLVKGSLEHYPILLEKDLNQVIYCHILLDAIEQYLGINLISRKFFNSWAK